MKYWRSTFLSAKGDTDICKIPPNSNWPWLFNIFLKINYLPLFSLRTSLICIEAVFEAPSTKLLTLSILFLFVLINQLHQLLSLQSRSCFHLTSRSDWNNSKVIRPFCANGQNQNSPKNIKGQFFFIIFFCFACCTHVTKEFHLKFQGFIFS